MNDRSFGAARLIAKIRTGDKFRMIMRNQASRPNNDIAEKDNGSAEPAVH